MFKELHPHLVELRKRLGISVASLVIMFFVMFSFHEALLNWMVEPLNTALIEVGKVSVHAADGMITTSQVGGAFFVALKVSFFAAILASIPVILSQIWMFIAPGLYAHEKKMVIPFVLGGSIMFLSGVLFAYYIVTPFGFDFLITFGSFKFTPLINIEDYVGFFTKIMFGFGLAFQLPVFAYFLALLGLINDKQMIAFFKYAIVIIFIVAALLTPPDVLTQLLMAGPLIILYGASILIVKAVNPAEDEDEEEDDDDNEEDQEDITQTTSTKE
jgi:sec-independent protein translocase protein TatC